MQRQKSILSFLKKPSPEDQSSNYNTVNGGKFQSKNTVAVAKNIPICSTIDLKEEILGTETLPEKVPRQIFPFNDGHDGNKSSVFSSIRHKFFKVDSREKPRYHYCVFPIFKAFDFLYFYFPVFSLSPNCMLCMVLFILPSNLSDNVYPKILWPL